MNKRAATWLLAALLAISAGAAVPVSRSQSHSSGSAIVWIARQRVEQRVPQRKQASVQPASDVLLAYQPAIPSSDFAASLYQRPPPFALC